MKLNTNRKKNQKCYKAMSNSEDNEVIWHKSKKSKNRNTITPSRAAHLTNCFLQTLNSNITHTYVMTPRITSS
jgi:hypothetical protein